MSMSHARTTVEDQPHTLIPGDTIRVINKRNEPEPEGTIILNDNNRMLVLVEIFLPDRGSTRWWIPSYRCVLVKKAAASNEPAAA